MPTPLGELMLEIEIPSSADARARFLARQTQPARRRSVLIAIVAAAALIVSPVGQTAIAWVGEQVGIGDPATVEERPLGGKGSEVALDPQTVIGSGSDPEGRPYELVAARAPVGDGLCIFLDFPTLSTSSGPGTCGVVERLPSPGTIEPPAFTVSPPGGRATVPQYAYGFAPPETAHVRIGFRGGESSVEEVEAAVYPVAGDLAAQAKVPTEFIAYVGFISEAGAKALYSEGGALTVTSVRADGEAIASAIRRMQR